MKGVFKVFILAIVPLLFAGCAGPTPYQRAEGQGGFGYSDYHKQDNIYHVTFRANTLTDWGAVVEYFNRRAKEVCVEQGYQAFHILSDANIPDGREISGRRRFGGTYGQLYGTQSTTAVEQNHQVSGSVECLKKSQ
jgi:hypothetical protein